MFGRFLVITSTLATDFGLRAVLLILVGTKKHKVFYHLGRHDADGRGQSLQ